MKLSKEEERIFRHLTGCDDIEKDPLWRNYANLNSNDPLMNSLKKKGLVRAIPVDGCSADTMWVATKKGKEFAKDLWNRHFSHKIIKNLRKQLESANNLLFNNGLAYFSEFDND